MNNLNNIIEKHDFSGKKILIVEDDFSSLRYAAAALGGTGAEILSTGNGKDAIDMVNNENIDIIFMDMKLPLMNGYDATKEIRKINNKKSEIPIIAYTASVMVGDKEKCIDAGCTDYLAKPVFKDEFLSMLNTYLK